MSPIYEFSKKVCCAQLREISHTHTQKELKLIIPRSPAYAKNWKPQTEIFVVPISGSRVLKSTTNQQQQRFGYVMVECFIMTEGLAMARLCPASVNNLVHNSIDVLRLTNQSLRILSMLDTALGQMSHLFIFFFAFFVRNVSCIDIAQ